MYDYDGFPSVFFDPNGTQHVTLKVEEDAVLVGSLHVPEEIGHIENVGGEIKWEEYTSKKGHPVRRPSFKTVEWYDRKELEKDIEACNFISPENVRTAYVEHRELNGFRFEMHGDSFDMYAIR